MNKNIGLQLLVYSLLLAGLSFLANHLAPALGRLTLITGLAGGALCLIWALGAMAGSRGKALSVLTLVPVNFILLYQTVAAWGDRAGTGAAIVITVLLGMSYLMLMRIVHAGNVVDLGQTSPAKHGRAK